MAHAALGDDPVRALCRGMAFQIQAVRLMECGWEAHIDMYTAPELVLLATYVPRYQALVLLCAAQRIATPEFILALDPHLPDVPETAHE